MLCKGYFTGSNKGCSQAIIWLMQGVIS